MWKERVVIAFYLVSQHFLGGTEEIPEEHRNHQFSVGI